MKNLLFIFITSILFISFSTRIKAETILDTNQNNKYGIHITNERDLIDAATLVNSTGGDWGYVTFVITEAERDNIRWQKAFDQMRNLHLIPIIRIATKAKGSIWEKPNLAEINNWTAFLNSLNWVVKNRYIVIYNEPNRAFEWGGRVDAKSYAETLAAFTQKLHESSPDFYVISAGLDSSAKNSSSAMEESKFIKQMIAAVPTVFDNIDGWSSHPYPNGKTGISTFEWELSYLKSLGVIKNLPVFITETGWSNRVYSEKIIGQKLIDAFANTWNNSNVIAVTPFILNYPEPPFAEFSWKKKDGTFYSFFEDIKNVQKIKGTPIQIENGQIITGFIQPIISTGADFIGAILVRNTGQSIWDKTSISLVNSSTNTIIKDYTLNQVEPGKVGLIFFKATTSENNRIYRESLYLTGYKKQKISNNSKIEALIVDFLK